MTQQQWIIFALKIVCVTGFASLAAWVVQYTRYTHGAAWRDPLGRTLVIKTSLIALLLVPTALSLFLHFNRLTSYVAGWVDVILIGAITPVMVWRILTWRRIHINDPGGSP